MTKIFRKRDFILNKCKDKSVLDLGCVEHDLFNNRIKDGTWLHMNFKTVAKSLVGVDILREYIPELQNMGYSIFYGNVEKLEEVKELKDKKFYVIIAGDLIEHLYNHGMFLDSIKLFCHKNTEIIITTPNCFSTHFFIPNLLKEETGREDHTCWFSEKTLKQLFIMNGFNVFEFYFRNDQRINGIRPFFKVMFKRLFPRCADGLIGVFKINI